LGSTKFPKDRREEIKLKKVKSDTDYRFVIAEDVVRWILDKRLLKDTFEDFCFGLNPSGIEIGKGVLNEVTTHFDDVRDYSYSDMVDYNGWKEIKRTRIYLPNGNYNDLIKVAEEFLNQKE
jgi:hypothetical protein